MQCREQDSELGVARKRKQFNRPFLLVWSLFLGASLFTGCSANSTAIGPGGLAGSQSNTPASKASITPSQARRDVGRLETVQFHVGYTRTDGAGTEFLDQYQNYRLGFVVTIFSSDVGNFPQDPASTWQGHVVDVSGTISIYDGFTEILNPSSITAAN
jgi:hypothetical protein